MLDSDIGVEIPTADRKVEWLLSQSLSFQCGHELVSSVHLMDMG